MGSLPETYNNPGFFFAHAHVPKCRSSFHTLSFFPLTFSFIATFLAHFIVFLCMDLQLWLANFLGKGQT